MARAVHLGAPAGAPGAVPAHFRQVGPVERAGRMHDALELAAVVRQLGQAIRHRIGPGHIQAQHVHGHAARPPGGHAPGTGRVAQQALRAFARCQD